MESTRDDRRPLLVRPNDFRYLALLGDEDDNVLAVEHIDARKASAILAKRLKPALISTGATTRVN